MRVAIEDALTAEALAEIQGALKDAAFRDGRATAGAQARRVKANEQADPGDPKTRAAALRVAEALGGHPIFALAARPRRLSPVMFSRYTAAMEYGAHVDDAVMRSPDGPLRADIAFTVFLSDPETYEGGALILETPAGESRIKLAAGAAFIYSADTLHRVEPVARGARLAAVGWAQSLVRDAAGREILFDLERAAAAAEAAGVSEAALLARKAVSNLLRRWAET